MLGWILFCVALLVVLTVLTLAWWRIGDQWADAEHKRFGPKQVDRPRPRVIPPPGPAPTQPVDAPEPPHDPEA